MALMTDSFTGTAGTDLNAHAADTGQAWARNGAVAGAVQLTSAGRVAAATTASAFYISSFVPASATYGVEADFVAVTQAGTTSLLLRFDPTVRTGYEVRVDPVNYGGIINLYRWTSGAATSLFNWAFAFAAGATHRIRATCRTYPG